MRAWTDQGRLRCLRINDRGDRRYRVADLTAFLEVAGLQQAPVAPFASRISPTQRPLPPAAFHPPLRLVSSQTRMSTLQGVRPMSAPDVLSSGLGVGPRVVLPQDDSHDADDPERPAPRARPDRPVPVEVAVRDALRSLVRSARFALVGIAERRGHTFLPPALDGSRRSRAWWNQLNLSTADASILDGRPIAVDPGSALERAAHRRSLDGVQLFMPVGGTPHAWGVIVAEKAFDAGLEPADLELLRNAAAAIESATERSRLQGRVDEQQLQTRALLRLELELGTRRDLPQLLSSLTDRALELFRANRAAVIKWLPDGRVTTEGARNLSDRFIGQLQALSRPVISSLAHGGGRAIAIEDAAHDPRTRDLHAAFTREGIQAAAMSLIHLDGELTGVIAIFHDAHHDWSTEDLALLEALAEQAGLAIRNTRNYEQMATAAAQLQSIQQLGTRLNGLSTVSDIAQAICSELRQLIDYHNVRVYRIDGDDAVPVAWRGEIGEYSDEDGEQLRLKVGEGITGWVAKYGLPQYLPNASADPRAQTIPGTDPDIDESMLLAPMIHEEKVYGVIVLSKLGINRFTGDDLRYLEIYASMAGQAMVNADATEQLRAQSARLAHQLESQRELMRVTESILSTLDPRTVVEEIADRLGGLLRVDNIGISVYDADAHLLRPMFAKGVDAEVYQGRTYSDEEGVSGWVARHGEAQLVQNVLEDPRVVHLIDDNTPGALIIAPLRSRDRVIGVLRVERLGAESRFEEPEFELIQLFAGHVSIALQNALAHQAVEVRARTDALTGLKNQGTFSEYLQLAVDRRSPFSLLIVDLDDFKAFNDRRGHEAGNVLLAEIARALRSSCRDSDEVFRYGGDEFALILPNTDVNGAIEVANKVGRAVRTAPAGPGSRRASGVTCSVGIAAFPTDAPDRDALLLAADRACYVAKRNGRDHAVTAADALALAGDVLPQPPTPVDDPQMEKTAAA